VEVSALDIVGCGTDERGVRIPRSAPRRFIAPAMVHELARMLEEDVSEFAPVQGPTKHASASMGTVEVCPISSHRLDFVVTPDGPALMCADHACPYRRPLHAFGRITTDLPCGMCGRPLMIRLGSRGVFAGVPDFLRAGRQSPCRPDGNACGVVEGTDPGDGIAEDL